MADDGRGIIIPVGAASQDAFFKVWEGDGVEVSGSPPTDASQEGSKRETALGNHGPWREPRTYKMAFLTMRDPRNCPV